MPILSDSKCKSYYKDLEIDVDSNLQVCAGRTMATICNGDSGGPLVAKGTDGLWYLVGIASYGDGCGEYLFINGKIFQSY